MVPSAAGGVFELAQTQQVTMEDMLAQLQASKNLLDALRALPRFPDISRSECARLQGCLALPTRPPRGEHGGYAAHPVWQTRREE